MATRSKTNLQGDRLVACRPDGRRVENRLGSRLEASMPIASLLGNRLGNRLGAWDKVSQL